MKTWMIVFSSLILSTVIEVSAQSAPPTPTLSTPVQGAVSVPVTTNLVWNASTGATSYQVQVATDSLFNSLIVDDSTVATTSRAVGPLNNNTVYYWQVRAINAGGKSAYSTRQSFTTIGAPPGTPGLTAPANNATHVAVSTTLTWTAPAGATSYHIQLGTDSTFTTTTLNDSTDATNSLAVSLANDSVYYWHVSAKDSLGVSAYSARRAFTTYPDSTPAVPTLTTPAQAASNVADSISFIWGAAAGATSYGIQISTDSTFSSTFLVNDSGLTRDTLPVNNLVAGNTYYWRVNAKNAFGTSAYSTRRNFSTVLAVPGAPTLTAPAQAATNQADSIAFTWAAVAGATSYHIQISTDSTFSTTFVADDSGLTALTLPVNTLVNGNTYYWHVSAKNSFGAGAYSTRRNFSTVPAAPPAAPTLTAPAQAATNVPDSTNFSWGASVNATSYHIQISTDSTFATALINDSGLTHDTLAVTTLVTGNTYYWHVSAKNTYGAGAYSTRRNFATVSGVPAAPTLTAPAQAATNQADSIAFIWAAVAGATSYNLQVSTDSTFSSTFAANDSGIAVLTQSVNTLVNGNTYYWRVSAKNVFGAGAYSTRRNFSTLPAAPPTAPALNTPAQGATNVAVTSNLTWTASIGATSYGVQVSTDSTFSSTFALNDSGLTAVTLSTGLLVNTTTYYWRVDAKNAYGASAFSTARSFTTVALVAPTAPTLTSPAQNAANVALSTNVTWNAVAVATSYHLQFGIDSTFTTNMIDDSVLTRDTVAVGPLSNGIVYYWHVSAKNAAGTSAYSTRRNFTTVAEVPSAPTLSSPAQNATGVIIPTSLVWNASTAAVSYHVELSKDSTFATTVVNDSGVTGTSLPLTSIANDGSVYYWRVNATNSLGTSDYSVKWKFTVVSAPAAPVLTSPANHATNVPLSTSLTWAASTGATYYRVELSTDSAFGSTLVNDSVTATTVAVGPLPGTTVYYWRVSAGNAAGPSAFSTKWSYTSAIGIPNTPTLLSPANNATGVALSTNLSWNASTGAKSYGLQLSTDSTFTSLSAIVVNDTGIATATLAVGPLTIGTVYYWRVNAEDSLGISSYSARRSFTTTTVVGILSQGVSVERLSAASGEALQFSLPSSTHVNITLYDLQGKMQEKLLDEDKAAGNYTLALPAEKLKGANYFLDFQAQGFHKTLMLHF